MVNRYRAQWEQDIPDGFEAVMPVELFRLTWSESGEPKEAWFGSQRQALDAKRDVDHSNGKKVYINYERWYAYRDKEHDRMVRPIPREKGWWE